MLPPTIQPTEIAWMVAAIPGLWLWFSNMRYAWGTLNFLKRLPLVNGRMVWARFSVTLTLTFVAIEAGFVAIGLVAMTTEPSPTSTLAIRWIFAGVFIAASIAITYIALRWRLVDKALEAMSRSSKRIDG